MVVEGMTAAEAGFRVGYDSPPQFSGDYVRFPPYGAETRRRADARLARNDEKGGQTGRPSYMPDRSAISEFRPIVLYGCGGCRLAAEGAGELVGQRAGGRCNRAGA
ncbi:hypothetical protein EV128_10178 [Rhizobium azibense]|nr:hypothetical protein EV128_10178 [Rhizobium azibense]